jgi:Rod binding domain-containing protein
MEVRPIDVSAVADLAKAPPSLTLPQEGGGRGVGERAAFKKAAIEFESFFLFYMMKSMRQAIPKSDLIRSNATDTYKSMFDQEVSNLAAKRGGLGLAKALESQFFPPPLSHLSFSAALPIKVTEEEGP